MAPEDRWAAARRLLKAFIAGRPDDRFALVLFSGHPVTLSPLTADHVRLYTILDRLELSSRDDGTAIGSALMTAVRRLSDSPARSRVILLLTDGAQNRGRVTALEAAEEAKNQGIRIHTVALGGKGESLYPIEGGGFAKITRGDGSGGPSSWWPRPRAARPWRPTTPRDWPGACWRWTSWRRPPSPWIPPRRAGPWPAGSCWPPSCWPFPWPSTWRASAGSGALPGWRSHEPESR